MRQLNLSTRNSKNLSHKDIRKSILTGLWIVFFLMVIDFTVNFLFAYPAASLLTNPSQLQLYFNYGHSIEGKVAQMVAPTDESSSAIAQAGWLDPNLWQKLNLPTSRASNEDLLVAIYGMSFSNHVGEAMKEIDPKIGLRLIAAPAGPPNYAYAAYKLDRGRHKADVAILGILASSVKGLSTLNGMTWQFEGLLTLTHNTSSKTVNSRRFHLYSQRWLNSALHSPTRSSGVHLSANYDSTINSLMGLCLNASSTIRQLYV